MAKLFKKSSAVDTLVNVGIGGAANVAMDYVFGLLPAETFASVQNPDTVKNAIKVAVGAFGGSMVSGSSAKYVRPALDGIATVGASQLISGLLSSETKENNSGDNSGDQSKTGRIPFMGGVGRMRMGQRGFRKVAGTGVVPFMS